MEGVFRGKGGRGDLYLGSLVAFALLRDIIALLFLGNM